LSEEVSGGFEKMYRSEYTSSEQCYWEEQGAGMDGAFPLLCLFLQFVALLIPVAK